MKKTLSIILALLALVAFTACSSGGGAASGAASASGAPAAESPASQEAPEATETPAESAAPAAEGEAVVVAADLPEEIGATVGPNGEQPVSAAALELTPDEVRQLKDGNYKAAIVWHQGGDTFITKHTEAIKATFEKVGIEVVAVTDAELNDEKQFADVESVLALNPDIIIAAAVDKVACAPLFQDLSTKVDSLVFMDTVPDGMKAPEYVSTVSSDNYGNGVNGAHMMVDAIGTEGTVGIIHAHTTNYPQEQRKLGFMETMEKEYPDIEVIAQSATVDEVESTAAAMLTRYPDMKGIFAWFDEPCIMTAAAARLAGRDDLKITGVDLGTDAALALAKQDMIVGISAQRVSAQGAALAILGCYGLLDKQAPDFVLVPGIPTTHDNVDESWEACYMEPAPQEVLDALG